ncbi:hypothetical protein B0H11DRAFT_2292375 [Mycena galericulata]|nr:hypothetical protein B0H11DRAFT_2292375 [Mycena galericulata]
MPLPLVKTEATCTDSTDVYAAAAAALEQAQRALSTAHANLRVETIPVAQDQRLFATLQSHHEVAAKERDAARREFENKVREVAALREEHKRHRAASNISVKEERERLKREGEAVAKEREELNAPRVTFEAERKALVDYRTQIAQTLHHMSHLVRPNPLSTMPQAAVRETIAAQRVFDKFQAHGDDLDSDKLQKTVVHGDWRMKRRNRALLFFISTVSRTELSTRPYTTGTLRGARKDVFCNAGAESRGNSEADEGTSLLSPLIFVSTPPQARHLPPHIEKLSSTMDFDRIPGFDSLRRRQTVEPVFIRIRFEFPDYLIEHRRRCTFPLTLSNTCPAVRSAKAWRAKPVLVCNVERHDAANSKPLCIVGHKLAVSPHPIVTPDSFVSPPTPMAYKFFPSATSLRLALCISALALLLLLTAGSARVYELSGRVPFFSSPDHGVVLDAGKRVYLRSGVGGEGMGATLQHFKHSIVLARALDASLVLASQTSHHGYSTSQIYNAHRDPGAFHLDARRACVISEYVPPSARDALVRGLCAGEPWAAGEMEKIKAGTAGCTSFVDAENAETTEDLNGCIMDWVRERLAPAAHAHRTPPPPPLPPLSSPRPRPRPLKVGVHVRWGDTAGRFPAFFYGSMSIPHINRLLADIRATLGPVLVSVAMQGADRGVLARLDLGARVDVGDADANATGEGAGDGDGDGEEKEKAYTLIDSGDSLADLYALSDSDVLLLGESSYGVLAHLIAPPGGLTIVDDQGQNHHKYTNTTGFGRSVVYIQEYTPEVLREVFLGGGVVD